MHRKAWRKYTTQVIKGTDSFSEMENRSTMSNTNAQTQMSGSLSEMMEVLGSRLHAEENFDLIYRVMELGDRSCALYFLDGMTKDEILEKIIEFMLKQADGKGLPENAHAFSKKYMPYGEIGLAKTVEEAIPQVLSGITLLIVDGYNQIITIDCRTYPSRGVEEPGQDKVFRGSKDGFVETMVFNMALIRRRIRDPELIMEAMQVGKASKTDVVLAYMKDRVDPELLTKIRNRLASVQVDALNMNQESLAECLFPGEWYNPFPKFKFSERPDVTTAHLLEGNLVILVDNAPSAMILPSSVFDIVEEANDYYFPPITGTYLRLSRLLISVTALFLTPLWLLLMQNPQWIPVRLSFIQVQDDIRIPLIWQFLILEMAIDGLKLAAVNTPSMLTTPLSVIAGIMLGDYAVSSGWFNAEPLLYMAFVSIANYTQANFELSYALKFMRVLSLILTALLDVWGFVLGCVLTVVAIACNKTISGKSYLAPLIPFSWDKCRRRFLRQRLKK